MTRGFPSGRQKEIMKTQRWCPALPHVMIRMEGVKTAARPHRHFQPRRR
jgi:hypothetical protein